MKIDGRRGRRARTEKALQEAIKRLSENEGNHPLHIGLRVLLTREAVAREARVGVATVYRFKGVCEAIDAAKSRGSQTEKSASEQRRSKNRAEINELHRRVDALLCENVRLTREVESLRARVATDELASRRRLKEP